MKFSRVLCVRPAVALAFVAACGGGAPQHETLPIAGSSAEPGVMTPATASGSAGSAMDSASRSNMSGGSGAQASRATSAAGASVAAGGAGSGATSAAGTRAGVAGAGSGGMAATALAGTGGSSASAANGGSAGTDTTPSDGTTCESLPPVTDYTMPGPFNDVKMFSNLGPSNNYTLYRPTTSLGKDGFKHPVATWGNGILTTPDMYKKLLTLIASHGFVVIACNDEQVERACLNAGMDWLVQQNTVAGDLQGKLDTAREVTIGYSWGGGAAIDTANRPNVKTTISLHGMPPRETNAWTDMHAPLMLTTSTGDNFVTASGYVTPNYDDSKVQTFYGTLQNSMAGHLYIADKDAGICIGAALGDTFGTCGDAESEQGPAVAWLRYWACKDQGAQTYFFGDDCVMCKSPWVMPQRKNWM